MHNVINDDVINGAVLADKSKLEKERERRYSLVNMDTSEDQIVVVDCCLNVRLRHCLINISDHCKKLDGAFRAMPKIFRPICEVYGIPALTRFSERHQLTLA